LVTTTHAGDLSTRGGACDGVRVAIVDEYPAFARGVAEALAAAGADVVFAGASVSEAMEIVDSQTPDVVLVEPWMRGADGLGLIADIARSHPDMHVVALSRLWDPDHVREATAAGASGHLRKDTALGDLPSVIRFILTGAVIRPAPEAGPGGSVLTNRERDVVRLLATGLSNTQIAEELNVSDQTVKYHLHNAYGKLGVRNRVGAVHRAGRLGILG
jgi:DNA-binding NarL/FixJ family response regulator